MNSRKMSNIGRGKIVIINAIAKCKNFRQYVSIEDYFADKRRLLDLILE